MGFFCQICWRRLKLSTYHEEGNAGVGFALLTRAIKIGLDTQDDQQHIDGQFSDETRNKDDVALVAISLFHTDPHC